MDYAVAIKQTGEFPEAKFAVTVRGAVVSEHSISLSEAYWHKLTNGKEPAEKLVERSVWFLLAREPNTAILSHFKLSDIGRYFPEFEAKIKAKE